MTEEQKKQIAEIAKNHKLALLALFGSYATGYTHKRSDVDVGFISEREIDFRENYEICEKLAPIFHNHDIDFVNLNNISPDIKKQVADQGILLYADSHAIFELFKIHANRIYLETKPLRIYRDRRLKDIIKSYARN
ncbi:MAG: nucleotidyltransferase domain-containing protein [Candidatus Paceibacterota bacterium]|jgi:predicted nucleotidyltransferase